MQFAVVDEEGMTDELGDDRAGPFPGLHRLPVHAHRLDPRIKLGVDVRAFFGRTTHRKTASSILQITIYAAKPFRRTAPSDAGEGSHGSTASLDCGCFHP